MGISIVTLQGMNAAYSVHHDGKNIFNGIRVPELIDEETLINRIVLRCGELDFLLAALILLLLDADVMLYSIVATFTKRPELILG